MSDYPENYPESRKLAEVPEVRRAVTDFLEWLATEHEARVGHWVTPETFGEFTPPAPRFVPLPKSADELVLEYLGIDRDKLERERQDILKLISNISE